jgi:triacylglycerol lipase
MEASRLTVFAKISGITYEDPDIATPLFKELGYNVVKFFDKKGAQAYLLSNDVERVLSFRGTQPKEKSDVTADLTAGKNRADSGGKVHVGFKTELDKIWTDIKKELGVNPNSPLFVTGHSLGAAMATIAVSRMQKDVVALATFGSPRVGNQEFVDHVTVDHYRVQNNCDDVPKVPPELMGFVHHGTNVYLNYHGEIRNLNGWQKFKDQVRSRLKALRKFKAFVGVYDHMIDRYIFKLEKL